MHDSTLALLCRSRPIVESSSRLRLACFSMQYSGLAAQLEQQRMSPFHNFWSHVYDFTPATAGEGPHWELVRGEQASSEALFPQLPSEVKELQVGADCGLMHGVPRRSPESLASLPGANRLCTGHVCAARQTPGCWCRLMPDPASIPSAAA